MSHPSAAASPPAAVESDAAPAEPGRTTTATDRSTTGTTAVGGGADVALAPAPGKRLLPLRRPRTSTGPVDGWLRTALRRTRDTGVRLDILACLGFLLAGLWVGHGLWPYPGSRVLALNAPDQILDEWFLALGPRLWTGHTGLVTTLLNVPDGVNLLSNASLILPAVLLAPVTVAFGVPVSFAVLVVLNLAATAAGWYLLFSRGLSLRRGASVVGAAFCGFAPGMVSQSNSHLHITAQWLVPAIAAGVIRLARAARRPDARARVVTSGVLLGGLMVLQLFAGEEVLLLTAATLVLLTIGYALTHRSWVSTMAPRFAAGLGVAVSVGLAGLAYPLAVQFLGPQHVPNGTFSPDYFLADLASFAAYSPLSLAGSPGTARLATGAAEYNTFLGVPLLLLVAAIAVWQRRRPMVVVTAVTAAVMCALALGPTIVVNGTRTGYPGPFRPLVGVPVLDGALPSRFALAAIPLVGMLLAVALDAAVRTSGRARLVVPAAVALALLPLVPVPLPTAARTPLPRFISGGYWRTCVRPGGVLVPAPPPTPREPHTMAWAAATGNAFALPEGMFIGPYARGGRASMGTAQRPTSALLSSAAATGAVPAMAPGAPAQARADLAFWRASCVVLVPGPHAPAVKTTLERLLGPGEPVADTWIWRT